MIIWLLTGAVLGAELWIDARMPTQVALDGEPIVQILRPAEVRLDVDLGPHELVVMLDGKPHMVEIEVMAQQATRVLIGRSGISTGQVDTSRDLADHGRVELRVVGDERLQVQLGSERYPVSPGDVIEVTLAVGDHPLSLRSVSGTTVYSKGVLAVDGRGDLILQVAGGRLPELSGPGGRYHPDMH